MWLGEFLLLASLDYRLKYAAETHDYLDALMPICIFYTRRPLYNKLVLRFINKNAKFNKQQN